MHQHPLAPDAVETLTALCAAALDRAARAERRLEEPDTLPRGPLPIYAKIAEHRTTALHLQIAIDALSKPALWVLDRLAA